MKGDTARAKPIVPKLSSENFHLTDLNHINRLFKIGGYFGIIPINFTNRQLNYCNKITTFMVLIVAIAGLYMNIQSSFSTESSSVRATHVLRVGVSFAEGLYFAYTFIPYYFNKKQWVCLLQKITDLERNTKNFEYKLNRVLYIKLIVVYLSYISAKVAVICFWDEYTIVKKDIYVFLFGILSNFYTVYITTYYILFSDWIKSRYDHIYHDLSTEGIRLLKKTRLATQVIKHSTEVIMQNDAVFGKVCFLTLFSTVYVLVYTMSFAVYHVNSGQIEVVLNFVTPLRYIVSISC